MINQDMREVIENLARDLHRWYLEATKQLVKGEYNEKAQKSYDELTLSQQFIDKFIAEKIILKLGKGYKK